MGMFAVVQQPLLSSSFLKRASHAVSRGEYLVGVLRKECAVSGMTLHHA